MKECSERTGRRQRDRRSLRTKRRISCPYTFKAMIFVPAMIQRDQ
jgi:hypothetical protein